MAQKYSKEVLRLSWIQDEGIAVGIVPDAIEGKLQPLEPSEWTQIPNPRVEHSLSHKEGEVLQDHRAQSQFPQVWKQVHQPVNVNGGSFVMALQLAQVKGSD